MTWFKRSNKYRAKKCNFGEEHFDSKREMGRYLDLLALVAAGEVRDLRRQIKYALRVNGQLVCKYIADFVYQEKGGIVVEDCKGFRTREYRIKKKLFFALTGKEILET